MKYLRPIIIVAALFFLGGVTYTFFSEKSIKHHAYRIAVDESWYPLELYDKRQYISAFSEDLLRAIAAQQNFPVQLVRVDVENVNDLLDGLDKKEFEGVLSSITPEEENDNNYLFSSPYYLLGPVLVVAKSSDIKSLNDLNGKTIGLIKNTEPINPFVRSSSTYFVFYDYSKRIKLVDDVRNKVIDGMFLGIIPAHEYAVVGIYRNELKIISKPLTDKGLRLIASKSPESEKLIEQFNEGLKAVKKSGVYHQLLVKWELFDPEK